MSLDLNPRGRRSSVSEHIQRVFHVDRLDKQRQSVHSEGNSAAQSSVWKSGSCDSTSEAATNYETPGGSSFTYSSKTSRQPSPSTLRPDRPSRLIVPEGEPNSTQHMASSRLSSMDAERDKICSSPTWHKDNARKERRATKRLEADRKDLEERLLRLEANQARLEQGIYERNPRRLTKKKPLSGPKRSTSAHTESPRSSSAFSALFSSSRRSSRSRPSSVSGNDAASRRCSSDYPPTLSLTLPERFGAAVSRELATRDGTSLLPSYHLQRTLHTTPKSDDLRENWRMAEAWQRQYGDHGTDTEKSAYDVCSQSVAHDIPWKDEPRSRPHTREPSADLDREPFTANLWHGKKLSGTKPTVNFSVAQGSTASESNNPSSGSEAHVESHQQVTERKTTRVATARQLTDLASSRSMQGAADRHETHRLLSGSVIAQRNHLNSRSLAYSKIDRSSSLELEPPTNDNREKKEAGMTATKQCTGSETTSRVSESRQYEEPRRRDRQPVSPHRLGIEQGQPTEVTSNEQRQPANGSRNSPSGNSTRHLPSTPLGNQQPGVGETRSSPIETPPLKHAGRSVSLTYTRPDPEKDENRPPPTAERGMPVDPSREPEGRNNSRPEEASRGRPDLQCSNAHTYNRSPSPTSSHASYNTADEERLNVPRPHQSNVEAPAPDAHMPSSPRPRPNDRAKMQNGPSPPLARGGSLSVLRKRPKRKVETPLPDQLVAKVFVICCRCNYWHDMPSDVYARLACPERLPSDSLLARTFSRRNSSSRKGSLRESLLSSVPSGKRRQPMTRPHSNDADTRAARESEAATGTPLAPPSCCWCGHNMSRSCCQGWTTLVQMRERHH